MSTDTGVGGVFGILLSSREEGSEPHVAHQALLDHMSEWFDSEEYEDIECDEREAATSEWAMKMLPRFIEAFEEEGIIIPKEALLLHSGDEDDRPARCDTSAGEWILGFGLLTRPWEYPELDESFRAEADFHTWVWMG